MRESCRGLRGTSSSAQPVVGWFCMSSFSDDEGRKCEGIQGETGQDEASVIYFEILVGNPK